MEGRRWIVAAVIVLLLVVGGAYFIITGVIGEDTGGTGTQGSGASLPAVSGPLAPGAPAAA